MLVYGTLLVYNRLNAQKAACPHTYFVADFVGVESDDEVGVGACQ